MVSKFKFDKLLGNQQRIANLPKLLRTKGIKSREAGQPNFRSGSTLAARWINASQDGQIPLSMPRSDVVWV